VIEALFQPLFVFLITMAGQRRILDTDYATPAAACQSALVLQVELRTARGGDPHATVTVLRTDGAQACATQA
jgi:hypothetical protein